LAGADRRWIVLPAADLLFLVVYIRFVRREPVVLTIVALTLSAVLLALAPLAVGATGLALWVFYPLLPLAAGFVLGQRRFLWWMAAICSGVAGLGAALLLRDQTASFLQGPRGPS